ncbi:ASCH domain-containing protein [Methanopyrus sp.]
MAEVPDRVLSRSEVAENPYRAVGEYVEAVVVQIKGDQGVQLELGLPFGVFLPAGAIRAALDWPEPVDLELLFIPGEELIVKLEDLDLKNKVARVWIPDFEVERLRARLGKKPPRRVIEIMTREEFFDLITEGLKTAEIRPSDHRSFKYLEPGDTLVFKNFKAGTMRCVETVVKNVEKGLDPKEAAERFYREAGFESPEECLEGLKEMYDGLPEKVDVAEFEPVREWEE